MVARFTTSVTTVTAMPLKRQMFFAIPARESHPQFCAHNTVQRGNTYHVERHAYHEVTVPNHVATSTLVCMHGRAPGAVMVVGLDGYPETIAFKRTERRADDFLVQLST